MIDPARGDGRDVERRLVAVDEDELLCARETCGQLRQHFVRGKRIGPIDELRIELLDGVDARGRCRARALDSNLRWRGSLSETGIGPCE